jgi:hypothetical protein
MTQTYAEAVYSDRGVAHLRHCPSVPRSGVRTIRPIDWINGRPVVVACGEALTLGGLRPCRICRPDTKLHTGV